MLPSMIFWRVLLTQWQFLCTPLDGIKKNDIETYIYIYIFTNVSPVNHTRWYQEISFHQAAKPYNLKIPNVCNCSDPYMGFSVFVPIYIYTYIYTYAFTYSKHASSRKHCAHAMLHLHSKRGMVLNIKPAGLQWCLDLLQYCSTARTAGVM